MKLSELPPEELSENSSFDRDEVIHNIKESPDFLAGICVPDIFKFFFPPIFVAVWGLLKDAVAKQKGLLQLAIGIPRGFAKTFILKLFTVFVILFSDRQFILIVCNTEALAMNFMSDVFDILNSPNIKMLFGDWSLGMEKDTQALKKFGFRGRDIIVAGIGVGTSMRGLNLKFRRPDIVIMDDMQSREDAEVAAIAKKQLIWMMGTLMKARNYTRCLFIFVGNMYPFEDCILRKLKLNPKWISFICGGILADGKSLWEDLRPLDDLLAELENDIAMGHPEIFYSEVLNDEEAGSVSGIDVSSIPPYPPYLDELEPQAGCIIIDPASGKSAGNDVAIGLFLIYDAVPVFRKVISDKLSPGDTVQTALLLAMQHGIKLIAVESNAYQFTLIYWFDFICRQLKLEGIQVVELYASNYSKNSKIKNMLPMLLPSPKKENKVDIILHPEVRSQVVSEIVQWNPLKIHNIDNVLDLLAWVYKAIELYGHSMELMGITILSKDMMEVQAATPEEMMLPF